jgi:hypothetical protein
MAVGTLSARFSGTDGVMRLIARELLLGVVQAFSPYEREGAGD